MSIEYCNSNSKYVNKSFVIFVYIIINKNAIITA
uniref:Uncharacterized protein n=1 Tax=Gloeochaete wittrockiana TaxID=38269 RepID=A0A3G1IW63_9EUKA|nr:hypothetical protein [Gloeochaete wittrockiana]ASQ40189.1 hypothetical protein [Gloeochaete wittrockiana]